jgi:tetratricopeptide (TPR) repeat protein
MNRRGRIAGVLAGVFVMSEVMAAELPPIPDKTEAEFIKGISAPWHEYLIKARAAERIGEPLQRCLAFPDLPGNKWPARHAEAHCRYHNVKVISLPEVEGYLQRGEVATLERLISESLAKHFSEEQFSEEIHPFYEQFQDANPETDRISALWLDKAPRSAFALLARGSYFEDAAWNARGTKWARETPGESLREMTRLADQAVPLIKQAIKAEPRLMPAYVSAIDIAKIDSSTGLGEWAFKAAQKVDAGCTEVVRYRMGTLTPRWGGSYEAMLAYANALPALYGQRPQIAMYQGAPFADRGDRLIIDDQFTEETAQVLDIAITSGSNEEPLRDAANLALFRTDAPRDSLKALGYLLQESRFKSGNAWADRNIGRVLLDAQEPEWALKYLSRAADAEPDDAWGQFLLGMAWHHSRRYEEGEAHYRLALKDERQARAALRELSYMWLYHAGLPPKNAAARAKPYIDQLLDTYPDDGRGLLFRMDQMSMSGSVMPDPKQVMTFLKVADRTDPYQQRAAERIEAAMKAGGK